MSYSKELDRTMLESERHTKREANDRALAEQNGNEYWLDDESWGDDITSVVGTMIDRMYSSVRNKDWTLPELMDTISWTSDGLEIGQFTFRLYMGDVSGEDMRELTNQEKRAVENALFRTLKKVFPRSQWEACAPGEHGKKKKKKPMDEGRFLVVPEVL